MEVRDATPTDAIGAGLVAMDMAFWLNRTLVTSKLLPVQQPIDFLEILSAEYERLALVPGTTADMKTVNLAAAALAQRESQALARQFRQEADPPP